ncbi:hypothetical protein K474DRAFT_1610655 [Panus rudis PR-1116 ss-1]|nr:hypothetical protein K474DRAFT_1610655 [Panus rudis PR-1116 ss-1]
MSWWPSSWLPTLPSIDFTLPSSIQKRFISFALRQTLGHLLKPGQLDIQQIDSQIGSGYVQIRDVELDNQAINALISGLPIHLHDGSVGKVTAQIPLPNPLTSSVGLSVESLHLTFYLSPTVESGPLFSASTIAESVASVADTFIHEELSAPEEAGLRNSFQSDLAASMQSLSEQVPGGLDPFTDEESTGGDIDPPGVSLFATLLERLLSRFEFDASDIKITIVDPERASFTLSIPEVIYGTEDPEEVESAGATKIDPTRTTARSISVSGLTITTRCLRPPSPLELTSSNVSQGTATVEPASEQSTPINASPPTYPYSDSESSDFDEETQMLMSQSIASLPPRPRSPSTSVTSSMYESAVSTSPAPDNAFTPSQDAPLSPSPHVVDVPMHGGRSQDEPVQTHPIPSGGVSTDSDELEDEVVLVLSSEPLRIRILTPIPSGAVPRPGLASTSSGEDKGKKQSPAESTTDERLHVYITLGTVACALRARHIRAILDIAEQWASHTPPTKKQPETKSDESPSILDHLAVNVQLRSVTVLLLPTNPSAPTTNDSLSQYFLHPNTPPRLPHGYVRAHLDDIRASLSTQLEQSQAPARTFVSGKGVEKRVHIVTFSVSDMAVLAFKRSIPDDQLHVSPILITDPNLDSQYPSQHSHPDLQRSEPDTGLPVFDIVDWTDPARKTTSIKLTQWRARPQYHRHTSNQASPMHREGSPFSASTSPQRPASLKSGSQSSGRTPDVRHAMKQYAVKVKITSTVVDGTMRSSRSQPRAPRVSIETEIDVLPLHIFVDFAVILLDDPHGHQSAVLSFIEELIAQPTGSQTPAEPTEQSDDEDEDEVEVDSDDTNMPGTPRAGSPLQSRQEREHERERKRLERLVLEDLDLGFDYTQDTPTKKGPQFTPESRRKHGRAPTKRNTTIIRIPVVRLQLRTSPRSQQSEPRAGAVIVDVHNIRLSPGGALPEEHQEAAVTFGVEPLRPRRAGGRQENLLLTCDWMRLVVSYAAPHDSKALALVSVGALYSNNLQEFRQGGIDTNYEHRKSKDLTSANPHITISRSDSRLSGLSSTLTTLAVALDIPSVFVNLSKPHLDGLQLWADDLTRLLEIAFNPDARLPADSDSIIGSHFFAKNRSRASGFATPSTFASSSRQESASRSETIMKVTVSEAALRLQVPRQSRADTLPFDVVASDIDLLLESKPEGKDETVITLGIMDLTISDIDNQSSNGSKVLLSLTTPRHLSSRVQSLLKLRFTSLVVPGTTAKESKVKVTFAGITYTAFPDFDWIQDLIRFAKAPPGTFETVVPSERTQVTAKVMDSSVRTLAPSHPGSAVLYIGETNFSTVIIGNSSELSFQLLMQNASLLLIDDIHDAFDDTEGDVRKMDQVPGLGHWKNEGYALVAELGGLVFDFTRNAGSDGPADIRIFADQAVLRLHLCADTMTALTSFIGDFSAIFASEMEPQLKQERKEPASVSDVPQSKRGIMASLDEHAFRRVPELGAAPDMITDDLPTNIEYLDDSFSASAGFRELPDDEEDDFSIGDTESTYVSADGSVSKYGGETIRMLQPELNTIEHYFDTLLPDSEDEASRYGETSLRVRIQNLDATLFLYDGYDWARTRRIIEEEARNMRRKLAKIRQLVASGQTPDPSVEETNTLLFNSVYIGLEHNLDELDPGALLAAIDDELNEESEAASQSSWQSFKPQPASPSRANKTTHLRRRGLKRSRGPSIEFRFHGAFVDIDHYKTDPVLASRTLVTIRDVEILDHIKTSTWKKFLTDLRTDSKGNIRETGSNMAKLELRKVYPVPGNPAEEARLRMKILPLRLHVDQDALDFLKKFFSFKDPESVPAAPSDPAQETFFQQAEIFPVDLKLDYKPRRVDYRALRDGRTIELMNFFHFDGAEMTLRHIVLTGITGWARVFELLNDLWTPDVKATQLVDVISGVAPIRSVVNVGSGVADLVLLPIAQYRKDGRVVRGLQKGTTAFVKSTATEAIKLGARLATGTQVILEQAETVLGGQFKDQITAEAVQVNSLGSELIAEGLDEEDENELISRYAEQPTNVKEGVQTAYRSLRRNFNSAAQTILAVPMEVYERSGNEGTVRAVVRAVPIAVLKPMIGASEAISKTLLGLHNTLDPGVRLENEAKYKQR